jgi:cohesin complex subunit SCC1
MLTLPDTITDMDLMPALPDALLLGPPGTADALDFNKGRVGRNEDITLGEWSTQQLNDSMEIGREAEDNLSMPDEELDLDLGDDLAPQNFDDDDETSIHMGREAPAARAIGDDLMSDPAKAADDSIFNRLDDDDGPRGVDDDMNFDFPDDPIDLTIGGETAGRASPSPSRAASNDGDNEFLDATIVDEDGDAQQPLRQRKKKVLQADTETTIRNGQIERQQRDRSKILQPSSFLPRDPFMLGLMTLQKNGGFVSNVFENRGKGWAPEIQDMFSLENIRKIGQLKRRRDSGVGDLSDGEELHNGRPDKLPRLSFGEDEEAAIDIGDLDGPAGDVTRSVIQIGGDDNDVAVYDFEDDDGPGAIFDDGPLSPALDNTFDVTVPPLVHPEDDGPISQGTTHVVHLLREQFGDDAADSPARRAKAVVKFQDLLPKSNTTKSDATKMFFEVLVLATKDAIKVDQEDGVLGGDISVRGKRGLWGAWAEKDAGGEIAKQAPEIEA